MAKQNHHKWEITGREHESKIPNIWTCSKCGLVRAEGWTHRRIERGATWWDTDRDERFIKEYSDTAGEFLTAGTKVPKCEEGAYR